MRTTSRALGTLSAVAFLLAACGGGSPTSAPTAAAGPTAAATTGAETPGAANLCEDVTQDGRPADVEASVDDFTWGPVEAKVGQVITWKNTDSAPHGVETDDAGCKMAGSIAVNGTGSLVFNRAGAFTFFCFVHPSMTGTITIS